MEVPGLCGQGCHQCCTAGVSQLLPLIMDNVRTQNWGTPSRAWEGAVDTQVGRRPVAVSVGGSERLAWRCHLFQGSGSHETEGSQSLGEHSESSLNTGSGPLQTCTKMYEVGVAHYSAVT